MTVRYFSFASSSFGGIYKGDNRVLASVISGTISKATGGKFANGALSIIAKRLVANTKPSVSKERVKINKKAIKSLNE